MAPVPAPAPAPAAPPGLVWPNADSRASSDPWLVAHHDEIRELRPRVLALDFVDGEPVEAMVARMQQAIDALAEGSRPHGYADPDASAVLRYEIAYAVDLRTPPGVERPAERINSALYPREDPPTGTWGFDYEALFSERFAALYGIRDPADPNGPPLDLCALVERGLVHDVWIYGDADVPDVSAAEVLAIHPRYDARGNRLAEPLSRCAGNGCFDDDDAIPDSCSRTLRIAWFNHTRGPGCFLESLAHGIEWTARDPTILPGWTPDFVRFARFDLDATEGLPFRDWYVCREPDCLAYPTPSSARWKARGQQGQIERWDPVCGSAHFPPNARFHYDHANDQPVLTSCRGFGEPDPELAPYTAADIGPYRSLAPDCMGAFLVWWFQNFQGPSSSKNWWVYLYY